MLFQNLLTCFIGLILGQTRLTSCLQILERHQFLLYLGWTGNTPTAANTLLSNTITGEAPQLSTNYAQYDSGANVFNFYDNFYATTLNTIKWNNIESAGTASSTANIAVSNGVTLSGGSGATYSTYIANTATQLSGNVAIDFFGSASPSIQQDFGFGVPPTNFNSNANSIGVQLYFGTVYLDSDNSAGTVTQKSVGTYTSTNTLYSLVISSGLMAVFTNSYYSALGSQTNTGVFPNKNYILFGQGSSPQTTSIYWARERTTPQNDILPNTTYGSVATPAPPTPTISPSSAQILDSGQSLTITSYESGSSTYTYNFIVFNSITNAIIANQLSSSNSFTLTTNSLWVSNSPVKSNVTVEDTISLSTSNSTKTGSITVDNVPTATITPTNTIIDSGQYAVFTASPSGGTGTFGTYNFIVFNSITNVIIANQLGSSSTFSFQTNSLWITNSPVKSNVIVTDTGTTSPYNFNSPNTAAITINSVPTAAFSVTNTILDSGQSTTFTATPSGGSGTFGTYNFIVFNSITNAVIAMQVGASATFTVTSNTLWTTNSPVKANVIVTDSGTTSTFNFNSVNTAAITINSAPTATISVTNTVLDSGQSTTFTATPSGGSGTFGTYNFIVFNSITNAIISIQVGSSSTFVVTTNSLWVSNSPVKSNVIVTDTGTTSSFDFNSPNSESITIGNSPTISITTVNSLIDQGQYAVFTATASGGSLPYIYNFILFNSITNTIVASQLGSSSTFSVQSNALFTSNSPLNANVFLTDNTGLTLNSILSNPVTVNAIPTAIITPSLASIGVGQTETFTLSTSNGILPFTADLWNVTSGGYQIGVSNVLIKTVGGSNSISLVAGTTLGSFTYNWIVTDYGPAVNVVFNSIPATIVVVSTSTTSTTSTTTSVTTTVSQGGGGGGGGSTGGLPCYTCQTTSSISSSTTSTTSTTSTSTTSTTTSTSTIHSKTISTTSLTTISTTIPTTLTTTVPQISKQINLASQTEIVFNNTNTTVVVSSSTPHGNATLTIKNVTGILNIPPPKGLKEIVLLNLSLITQNPFVTLRFTTAYPCSISGSQVAPYQYVNGSWKEINPFVANNQSCTVSFTVANSSTVGLFYAEMQPSQPQLKPIYGIYVIVALVIIAVLIGLDDLIGRRRLRKLVNKNNTPKKV